VEQLLTYLARALVDQPDQVGLRVSEAEGARLYELKVAPEDVGKVIGRGGRNIDAIRAVVRAAALKNHDRVMVEIV